MAPTYKPLTSAGGLTGAPGLPPEVFGAPQVRTIDDILREQEALRAQELANQSNEVLVAERQRIAQEGEARRQAIRDQYGDQPTESFNPDDALSVIQRLSIQQGDLDTALAIERTQKERKGSAPYSEFDRQVIEKELGYPLPEGATPSLVNTLVNLKGKNLYEQQLNDPLLAQNRQLNAILKGQQATGTQIKHLTPEQTGQITELESFSGFVDNVKNRYLPYISENRAERFLAAAANPNSAAARLNGELNLVATQLAAAYNGKRLSDLDFQTMSQLLKPNDLDTLETVADRLDRAVEFAEMRKGKYLGTLETARFNVTGFQDPQNQKAPLLIPKVNQGQLPSLADYGAPKTAPSSQGQDLSGYTPAQIQYMRSKGMIR